MLHLFAHGGDAATADGDAKAGKRLRLSWMKVKGGSSIRRRVKDIQGHRTRDSRRGSAGKILLTCWIPCSLWLMTDADAHTSIKMLRDADLGIDDANLAPLPSVSALTKARQRFGLRTTRTPENTKLAPVFIDPATGIFKARASGGKTYAILSG